MKQEKDLQLNNKKKNPAPRKKNSGAVGGKVRKALKPSDGTAKKKGNNTPQNSKPHKQKGAAKPEKSKKPKKPRNPQEVPVPSGKESEQVQRKESETGSPERVLPHHPVGGYEGNRKEHHGN